MVAELGIANPDKFEQVPRLGHPRSSAVDQALYCEVPFLQGFRVGRHSEVQCIVGNAHMGPPSCSRSLGKSISAL